MTDETMKMEWRGKLRRRLHAQFSAALGADPVCNGRVTSATVSWLADEAMRACEAVARHVDAEERPNAADINYVRLVPIHPIYSPTKNET